MKVCCVQIGPIWIQNAVYYFCVILHAHTQSKQKKILNSLTQVSVEVEKRAMANRSLELLISFVKWLSAACYWIIFCAYTRNDVIGNSKIKVRMVISTHFLCSATATKQTSTINQKRERMNEKTKKSILPRKVRSTQQSALMLLYHAEWIKRERTLSVSHNYNIIPTIMGVYCIFLCLCYISLAYHNGKTKRKQLKSIYLRYLLFRIQFLFFF